MTKNFSLFVSICLFMLSLSPIAQALDIADMAPEETLVYVQVGNLQQLRESWAKTPYSRLWKDTKMEAFFKPLKKKIADTQVEFEKKQNVSFDGLKDIFPGQIAGFVSDIRLTYNASTNSGGQEINLGLIGRYAGDKERVKNLIESQFLKDLPSNARRSTEEFQGLTIYRTEYTDIPDGPTAQPIGKQDSSESELGAPAAPEQGSGISYYYEYAFAYDYFVLLEGQRAFMKKVIANYFAAKNGQTAANSMGATAMYKNAQQSTSGKPDAFAYFNIERLIKQLASGPNSTFLEKAKPLRLEELKSAAFMLRLTPESTETDFILSSSPSPQGIARLLINDKTNEFATRKFVPGSATSYSSFLLDGGDVFRLVKDLASSLNEDNGQAFDTFLAQLSQGAQVDVADLVFRMSGEVASYTMAAAKGLDTPVGLPQANSVYLIQLKREEGFAENLAKLVRALVGGSSPANPSTGKSPELTKSDYKGFALYTLKPPASATAPAGMRMPEYAFSVAKSYLIVGASSDVVREALQHITGDSADNLSQNANFQKSTGRLKTGYQFLSWTDLNKSVDGMIREIQKNPVWIMMMGQFVQMTMMPAPEDFAKYFNQSVSAAYVTKDKYHVRSAISYPEGMAQK